MKVSFIRFRRVESLTLEIKILNMDCAIKYLIEISPKVKEVPLIALIQTEFTVNKTHNREIIRRSAV